MNARTVSLRVADDGTVTIPVDLVRALQLFPRQAVSIEARDHALVLAPSRIERLDRIGHLLRTALAGVEWSEVEAERRDRCF